MANTNPQVYYENEENHGNYQYVLLKDLVNNFVANYTGTNKWLRNTSRRSVVYHMKQGIKQFNISTLQNIKRVELNLTDAYYVILPPDFLDYVRISWLNKQTGQFHPLSERRNYQIGVSYLQDHEANVLFDDEGEILMGTSATEVINDSLPKSNVYRRFSCGIDGNVCEGCNCGGTPLWNIDTSINLNGYFQIDRNSGTIKFGSEIASEIIMLEYISDGLESSDESLIRVHKKAEMALYAWCNYQLLQNEQGCPMYEKNEAKRNFYALRRNAIIQMGNFRVDQLILLLSGQNRTIK